jgi:hypothetical protein
MAYSTGSGDYNALMAAVLAHAVADGWLEAGGIGTGWPISKGNVRGVDWSTFTISNTDFTNGGAFPKTTRWIRIAVGTSPANATANAGSTATSASFPNMEYTIDTWHIFSDPSIGDHINVVVQFSNGFDAAVFGHFSFGELNKHGMTYGGIAYASAHPCRGFAASNNGDQNFADDWHGGNYGAIYRHFTGRIGYSYTNRLTYNNFQYVISPTNSPFPALPIWPEADVSHDHSRLLDTYGPSESSFEMHTLSETSIGSVGTKMGISALVASSQPYSGGVSFMPLPILIANTTANSSTLRFINVGSAPNVRLCSLSTLLPGEEITYAGDTWQVFPMVCRKPMNTLGGSGVVTSGLLGFAYKKVI